MVRFGYRFFTYNVIVSIYGFITSPLVVSWTVATGIVFLTRSDREAGFGELARYALCSAVVFVAASLVGLTVLVRAIEAVGRIETLDGWLALGFHVAILVVAFGLAMISYGLVDRYWLDRSGSIGP